MLIGACCDSLESFVLTNQFAQKLLKAKAVVIVSDDRFD